MEELNQRRRAEAAATMAQRSMTIIDYYRHRGLFPAPPPPLPAAVVGDSADASSDVEDPPLDLPAANPAPPQRRGRGAPPPHVAVDPPPPPPFMHVPAVAAAPWQFDPFELEARHARRLVAPPPGGDEGPSRRQADAGDGDEASSKEGAAALPEPEEVYGALKAIPDLPRGDLLRAYGALLRDERQFRSLMALPRDMRKDWLLMEITNMQQQ